MRAITIAGAVAVAAFAAVPAAAPASGPSGAPASAAARAVEPFVLSGADVPSWSRLPARGVPNPHVDRPPDPSTADPQRCLEFNPLGCGEDVVLGALVPDRDVRDAHDGTIVVPEDARPGVAVDRITAYRWSGEGFEEIPVQVDERFPYHLANWNSNFAPYSGTDQELTYAWDVEAWKMVAGRCRAEYPPGEGPTPDPVPTLDDDDEIVFMASDAGARAPGGALGPPGTDGERVEVALVDPLDPERPRYVYLFLRDGGSAYGPGASGVHYRRHADAREWIDRRSFTADDPEQLGTSNTDYGPNLAGAVCDGGPARPSDDRFPRDGVTVVTPRYRWQASGRWMVREMRVARPGEPGRYGPDLIDRWKGRAFQQSPDSSISAVGFEDEQVNWEANSTVLGERVGPVRAIREVWGADSGTNVTKTETFYRDAVVYHYRLRVHPIPPDGIYTNWDYNAGVVDRYFNPYHPEGVAIDGRSDEVVPPVDEVGGQPAYFDAPDPTHSGPVPLFTWEQVSGRGDAGSLVYLFELMSPLGATNLAVVPYYRDDACFDDGTGDDPVVRPFPGRPSTDPEVQGAYAAMAGRPYDQLECRDRQGAWGSHGVHFLVTGDSDNAFTGIPINEVDARQWQFAVPTDAPRAVGEPYANIVNAPLRALPLVQPNEAAPASAGGGDPGDGGPGAGSGRGTGDGRTGAPAGAGGSSVAATSEDRGALPQTGGGALPAVGLAAVAAAAAFRRSLPTSWRA